jgi:hypothetical protein
MPKNGVIVLDTLLAAEASVSRREPPKRKQK